MTGALPFSLCLLDALDGAVAWLDFMVTAIDANHLVIAPGLDAAAIPVLRAELASLRAIVLPELRSIAVRSRQHTLELGSK